MISQKFDISGKVAIVTGSGSGIGKGIAKEFARAGAHVVVATLRADEINPVVEEVRRLGCRAIGVQTDVRKPEDVQNMVDQTVKEFGRIDILVNNAGATFWCPLEKMSFNGWNTIVGINLNGVFLCTLAVGKVMIQQKSGSIISIASNAARDGSPYSAHYGAAKAGVVNFTKSLAVEWAQYGIRINCISPGSIVTEGAINLFKLGDEESAVKQWGVWNALGHAGRVQEIALPAIFLASEAASYVTGVNVDVEGGPRVAEYLKQRPKT